MNVKNLKIVTKLILSSCVFIIPLGIMLFSIVSVSLASISRDQKEINGLEVLRPAAALMQIVPQYLRITVDNASGDLEYVKEQTEKLIAELEEKYTMFFGDSVYIVSPYSINENWNHLINTKIRDTVFWAYRQLMQDFLKIIAYVGDVSGLITDNDIGNAYLIAATVHELPQAQERMVIIGNLLRTVEDGAFTLRRREELQLNLDLLIHSDNARIQNRFNSAGMLFMQNSDSLESFEQLLKTCYDRLSYFASSVEDYFNAPEIDPDNLWALYEISSNANNSIYRLQDASLIHLGWLIKNRISSNYLRLFLSLSAAIIATLFAFGIITYTTLGIRKSTLNMGKVFRQLDNNDLDVKIETQSNDELGEFMTALKGFLGKLQVTFLSFNKNTSMVTNSVIELSSSAKQITATANEQSSSVSEIVSTMENNKELSTQAAEKTEEVAALAGHTRELSKRGADLRDVNEEMMLDIRIQNAKIIDIIRNLADMLSRIDESVALIDTIADHTKIIAFNAALEASSSGEAGARFSVVASEIRRFADNVVESASEIKEKISELHEASHTLMLEANNGTLIIDEGYSRMVEQKEVFENIVEASQNVAIRTQQISNLSKQQELASAQVFSALKEISSGVSQFVSATNMTSAAVEKINIMSEELLETLEIYHITGRE